MEKWNPEDYNYCDIHDQYYKQYCCGCALDLPAIKKECDEKKEESKSE